MHEVEKMFWRLTGCFFHFNAEKQDERRCPDFFLLITCCVCVIIVVAPMSQANSIDPLNTIEENYSILRQIQYSFTLQNKSNQLLKKAEFWTYAPVKQTSTQRCCKKIETSHPYELIEDGLGNQVFYFKFENMPPFASIIITIAAVLELSDASNIVPADRKTFVAAEKYIESDNPDIKQLAETFGSASPLKTSENVYQWVSENIKYSGYLKDERGALYAVKNKEGDCTEFADLFVALSRANDIPARSIGGYVYDKDAILKAIDYHNWAEFYDEGSWRIADPQKKVFIKDQSNYIAMRIIGESPTNPMGEFNRFRFSGDGLKVTMN